MSWPSIASLKNYKAKEYSSDFAISCGWGR
jgi:hypothetical protein